LVLTVGHYADRWSLQRWKQSDHLVLHYTKTIQLSDQFLTDLDTMTGVVLAGPHNDVRQRRSAFMGQNTQYMRGRLYDLTDKKAKLWLKTQHFVSGVQLIMEQNKFQQYGNDFKEWQDYFDGSQVHLLSDQYLWVNFVHAKTFVGDQWWAIQTANLTHSSLTKNREHFVLGTDPKIRKDLLQLFELDTQTILSKGKKNTKWYADWLADSSPNLLVCPLNCRQKIEYLLTHAQESIWISAQYVTDQRMIDILHKQQSLDIRILTNDTEDNYPLRNLLWSDRVRLQKTPYSHDKMLIIDGKYVVIGSMNFSDNALDNNREIGIVLTDSVAIEEAKKLFIDWWL